VGDRSPLSKEQIAHVVAGIAEDKRLRLQSPQYFASIVGDVLIPTAWCLASSPRANDHEEAEWLTNQLDRIQSHAMELRAALGAQGGPGWAQREIRQKLGDYSDVIGDLLEAVCTLREIAAQRTRPRGGQPSTLRYGADFHDWVRSLCAAAHEAGGRLTSDKNDIEKGTLPAVLKAVAPLLPPGFAPALSAGSLNRIRQDIDTGR
jgi:hypothetical protein